MLESEQNQLKQEAKKLEHINHANIIQDITSFWDNKKIWSDGIC
jgi:hypothetical protein